MLDFELEQYASLIVSKAVNIQKGQGVILYSSLEALPLINHIEKQAHLLGASIFVKRLTDVDKISDTIEHVDELKEEQYDVKDIDSFVRIRIRSEGPNYLSNIDNEKLRKYNSYLHQRDLEVNKKVHQWTIIAYPGKEWAKTLFPNLKEEDAVEELWKLIKKASRLEGGPLANWEKHSKDIHSRCDYLNKLKIKTLHYRSSNGTDFHISIRPEMKFIGGSVKDSNGIEYEPNIPSEEIYTAPDVNSAEGVIYATKPLVYEGDVYTDFGFEFSKGKVTKIIGDEKTQKTFQNIFNSYPNSDMLGEVAFVPYDSPINNLNVIFYKNLIDENASCHLALGDGITNSIKEEYRNDATYESLALNYSREHIDFMVGTRDMKITAETYEGQIVVLFDNGNWR